MISIITPVLNGEKFIEKNLLSVSNLTIPYEHIIIDGGSTDRTIEIISHFKNVKLLTQTDKNGMYGAIDQGFNAAVGEYICWINCDDCIYPENFETFYLWAKNKQLDFASSNGVFHFINENKKVKVRSTNFLKYFLKAGFFPFSQPSVIYSKKLYKKIGGLDFANFKIVGDMDLFYRMSIVKDAKFGFKNIYTTEFLKYGNSLGDNNTQKGKDERRLIGHIPKATLGNRFLLKLVRALHI